MLGVPSNVFAADGPAPNPVGSSLSETSSLDSPVGAALNADVEADVSAEAADESLLRDGDPVVTGIGARIGLLHAEGGPSESSLPSNPPCVTSRYARPRRHVPSPVGLLTWGVQARSGPPARRACT